MNRTHHRLFILIPGLALLLPGWLAGAARGQMRVQGEAIQGEPFGVGRLSVELAGTSRSGDLGIEGLRLTERNGRVLYPVVDNRPFRTLLRDLLGAGGQRGTVYFLFRGKEPLELTLGAGTERSFQLVPREDPWSRSRLMDAWWLAYAPPPRLLQRTPDYPPLLENYLRPMLGTRLQLVVPPARGLSSWEQRLDREVGLLMGTESIRAQMERDRMLGRLPLDEAADQPLPAAIDPPPLELGPLPEKVEVEPIAMRVPQECLYMRFGSVANFLWFRDQLDRFGGDFSNLVSQRGLDYEPIARMEARLALRQTTLSKTLGNAVSGLVGGAAVADVAMIGTDVFQRDGAALGVLFQARFNPPLAAEIARQRSEAVKGGGGVKEEAIDVDGHKVSYLFSPDGSIRSYHAVDGDFHLVTTSKALVGRFFATRSGEGSLGASDEFRRARVEMPLARGDTMFVYLSDAFFRQLVSPACRVEMTRRMQARVDLELVAMARLAAAAEGRPGDTTADLVAGGFLPAGFGPRPDGSRTEYVDGRVYDSLRGRLGSFVPVADVEVQAATPAEVEAYERFAEHYRSQWGRLDPVSVGIRRQAMPNNQERVVIDARVSPLNRQIYDTLTAWLGPADKQRLAPIAADVVSADVILTNQRIFLGIQDLNTPAVEIGGGRLAITIDPAAFGPVLKPLVVGYIGSYGDVGLLGLLDVLVVGQPDAAGYSGMEPGVSRRQFDKFTVYSYQRQTLAEVTERLKFVPADRPAQIRAHVGDVSQGKLSPMVNAWGYSRSRETCLGNLRLMRDLDQQLHVSPADCRDVAEGLLGAKLTCPLRGKYVYQANPQGVQRWTSTALSGGGGALGSGVPEGFQAPPLDWFRGLSLSAQLEPAEMTVHAEVQMELPRQE